MSFTLEELAGLPADELSEFTKRIECEQEVYDIPFDWSTHFVLVRSLDHLVLAKLNLALSGYLRREP